MYSLYSVIGYFVACMVIFHDLKIAIMLGGNIIMGFTALLADARTEIGNRKNYANVQLFVLIVFDILIFYFGLFFNWFMNEKIHTQFTFGVIHFTWAALGLSCWQNYLVFKIKMIYKGLMHPENMVQMARPLSLEEMNDIQANLLIAASSSSSSSSPNHHISSLNQK